MGVVTDESDGKSEPGRRMALNYLAPAAEEMNGGLCHLLRDKKEAVLGVRGRTSSLGDVLSCRCGDVLGEVSRRQWDTPVWG